MTKLEMIQKIKGINPKANVGRLWTIKKQELEEKLNKLITQKITNKI